MPSLYELTQDAAYLQNLLESGDIDDQTFSDSMESLMIDQKIENVCKMIRNLEAQADAYKAEKDRLADKEKTARNGVQRLKNSLLDYMTVTNGNKVQAGLFTVSIGTSKSVSIQNEAMIPSCFLIPQEPKIDKKAIGDSIKNGVEVPGAVISESSYIKIK